MPQPGGKGEFQPVPIGTNRHTDFMDPASIVMGVYEARDCPNLFNLQDTIANNCRIAAIPPQFRQQWEIIYERDPTPALLFVISGELLCFSSTCIEGVGIVP